MGLFFNYKTGLRLNKAACVSTLGVTVGAAPRSCCLRLLDERSLEHVLSRALVSNLGWNQFPWKSNGDLHGLQMMLISEVWEAALFHCSPMMPTRCGTLRQKKTAATKFWNEKT